jgi:hypothetical protein
MVKLDTLNRIAKMLFGALAILLAHLVERL